MKVYFLPYLASMWRSLAPLYNEHKAAGDDVHVMPIPFYVRNNAGEFACLHYDLYSFPVPVIDHKSVDLRAEHPDKIYIHNPYDDENRITSVDPAYYTPKLKECTDELIYAPYYTRAFYDIESCVNNPGCHNADKIMVWSEEQKNSYAKWITPDKIIVKEYPPMPETVEAPAEWKLDGRKLVLLNNSLGSLMWKPEAAIKAIDQVIRSAMKDHSIRLLWRPHPLYIDTINALFPRYGNLYMTILRRFAEWGDGIYDDSWDVDRAVILADQYVGNPSSVEKMFADLGKPITII